MEEIKLTPGYIVGFADGEGTFNLVRYPGGRVRPQFLLFNTDKKILELIKDFLNINSPIFAVSRVSDPIRRKKICYRLQVRSKEDLGKVLLFFNKNPPIIKKKEYAVFKRAWSNWIKKI